MGNPEAKLLTENIDTNLLRTFVTIAATKSITKSAEKLLRTQSAISMQVRRLEDALNCKLFYRAGTVLHITEEGSILLKYAHDILSLNDELRRKVRNDSHHYEITLGTSDDYSAIILPKILTGFMEKNENCHVVVSCRNSDENLALLNAGELDFGLVTYEHGKAPVPAARLEQLVWISAKDFKLTKGEPVALAGFPHGCICRNAMIRSLTDAQINWRFIYSSNSIASIHATILSSNAISAVEESTVPKGAVVLTERSGLPPLPPVEMAVETRHRRLSGIHRKFYEHLILGLRSFQY